jgi:hypothetical protein
MYADIIGAWRVHLQKMGFKKSNSAVLWKKMQVRGPKAKYAFVDQFRVITMSCMFLK